MATDRPQADSDAVPRPPDADGPDPGEAPRGRFRGRVAVLAGGRMVATAISAAWMVVAARQLPLAVFGDLVLLLGLGALFLVVNDFGIPLALTDAVASRPETARGALAGALGRRLALGALSAVLVSAAYLLSAGDRDPVVPLVFALSILATTVYTTATACFRGRSRVRAESVNEVVSRAAVLLAGGWWLLHGGGLLGAVVVYALADTGSALVLGAMAWRATAGSDVAPDRRTLSFRRVAPIALAATIGVVYYRVDLWLVALLRGPDDVALYGSAYRVVEALLLGATAVAALSVAHLARVPPEERMRRLAKLVALGLAVTAPPALVAALGGGRILGLLFGESYAQAGGIFRILVLAVVPSVVITVLGPVAFLRGRSRAAKAFAVVLVVNVALNLAFIPVLGVQAAAWATLACQTLLAALLWRSMRRWMEADGLAAGSAVAPQGA